jgi:hypothetical protein
VHADTSALRLLAAAQSRHAADLADTASRLAAAAPASGAYGPVGARFLAALSDSLARDARAVADLGERLASAGESTTAAASSFVDTERRVGNAVGSVGV